MSAVHAGLHIFRACFQDLLVNSWPVYLFNPFFHVSFLQKHSLVGRYCNFCFVKSLDAFGNIYIYNLHKYFVSMVIQCHTYRIMQNFLPKSYIPKTWILFVTKNATISESRERNNIFYCCLLRSAAMDWAVSWPVSDMNKSKSKAKSGKKKGQRFISKQYYSSVTLVAFLWYISFCPISFCPPTLKVLPFAWGTSEAPSRMEGKNRSKRLYHLFWHVLTSEGGWIVWHINANETQIWQKGSTRKDAERFERVSVEYSKSAKVPMNPPSLSGWDGQAPYNQNPRSRHSDSQIPSVLYDTSIQKAEQIKKSSNHYL